MIHSPSRFLFSILGIALSVLIMSMEIGFFNGLNDGQANLPSVMEADLVISSPRKKHLKNYSKLYRKIPHQVRRFDEVDAISDFYFRSNFWTNPQNQITNRALFMGVDLDDPMLAIPEIKQYREELLRPNTLLFDSASRDELGEVSIGTTTTVGTEKLPMRVVGLFKLGANIAYEGNVIMSVDNFMTVNGSEAYRRNEDWVDLVFVRLKPGVDVEAMRTKIQDEIPGHFVVHTPGELFRREVMVTTKETPAGFILGIGLIVGVIIGIVICYQILFNEVTDNISQFATVKAIGHPPSYIAGIVVGCSIILGVSGFCVGLVGSFGLYAFIEKLAQIQMTLNLNRIGLVFVVTVSMCVFSGILALRKVLKEDPADLF